MKEASKTRIEHDSMGDVAVPADRYWGAQTQRSLEHFPIGVGKETMPIEIVHAFGIVKHAAARVNRKLCADRMTAEKISVIEQAAEEVALGQLDDHFPLVVWQTGSGTHSNMNANEVIANRANELAGNKLCHPNDDINMSQSSNDCYPTAMRIAAVLSLERNLLPAVEKLIDVMLKKEEESREVLKCICRMRCRSAFPRRSAAGAARWSVTPKCFVLPCRRFESSLWAVQRSERV